MTSRRAACRPSPDRLPAVTDPTDRRSLLRQAFGRYVDRLVEQTQERVVQKRYLRPPGALPEIGFLAACTRCGECGTACPVRAIIKVPPEGGLAAGTPYLDVTVQACIACSDMPCARACPTDALTVPPQGWEGYRMGVVELTPERCVTFQGITCSVCAEACPIGEEALGMDEAGHPVLRAEGCVGCGSCVRACITAPSCYSVRPVP